MQSEDLDSLIGNHPDCLIAAYADLGTGVTLLTNSGNTIPREAIDELCVEAALTLGPAEAPPLGALPCAEAIKTDPTAIFIYMRLPDEPLDALCFMCLPSVNLPAFLADARACVRKAAA